MTRQTKWKPDGWTRAVARAIGAVAPGYAMRWMSRRAVLANYTGARPDGPNKGWNPRNESADALLHRDRLRLLARARDLERNSGHISGAINKIANNVIYTGIFPQARLRGPDGKLLKDENNRIEELHKEWAESDEVQFYDKQELVLRHLWVDGECLVHDFLDRDLLKKGVVPFGVELFEPDYLDHSMNTQAENGGVIKAGIEYNAKGRPAAFHVFKQHPGEGLWGSAFGETRRIPVENIRHVYHQKRASQGRGVSWLASIIMEMRDFSEYQSSERIAARLMSAFGLFVESPYPEHQLINPIHDDSQYPGIGDVSKYIEPGRIDVLPPGVKVSSHQYSRPGDTYAPFTKTSLKSASTGSGISYENFSNDYEGATYSSARQAVLEERRGYRKLQFFLNRHFNSWMWSKWIMYAQNAGMVGREPRAVPVQWQNPGWPWIDPSKDAKGAEMELKMKINTRRRLAAERGLDWDEEIEEYAEENEIMRAKGINPEPDETEVNSDVVEPDSEQD